MALGRDSPLLLDSIRARADEVRLEAEAYELQGSVLCGRCRREARADPEQALERIIAHEAMLPEHSGTTVRVAEVLTECDDRGVPHRVAKVSGFLIKVEEDGLMDEGSFLEGIRLSMNSIDFEAPADGRFAMCSPPVRCAGLMAPFGVVVKP
jgi:hypothetical protein